jgi:hypothetical protein
MTAYLEASAVISTCCHYRYVLHRRWDFINRAVCLFAMLNPSTANGETDDATVRKVVGFAQRWGFGAATIVNMLALRARDPNALLDAAIDPVGPDNEFYLWQELKGASLVVAAWGSHRVLRHPAHVGRPARFMQLAREANADVRALRLSKDGNPWHPLYVPYDVELVPFAIARAA